MDYERRTLGQFSPAKEQMDRAERRITENGDAAENVGEELR